MSTLKVAQEPMYLRDVEANPKPSVYRDLLENAKSSGGDYWQIWHLLAFDPEAAHHLAALSHTFMHKPSPPQLRPPRVDRSIHLVSQQLRVLHEGPRRRRLAATGRRVTRLERNRQSRDLYSRHKREGAPPLRAESHLGASLITAVDTQALNQAGWDDASIFYAISACALSTSTTAGSPPAVSIL